MTSRRKKNSAKFFVSEKLSKHATKQRKEIHKCTYYVAYKTERETNEQELKNLDGAQRTNSWKKAQIQYLRIQTNARIPRRQDMTPIASLIASPPPLANKASVKQANKMWQNAGCGL